tara:strand:+ start:168 stop:1154 length:987 start_codon:yes stop_codon:yes gene_type:complete
MKAAWFNHTGQASEVLHVGSFDDPILLEGHVCVRICASGVNPSDTKKRAGWGGVEMEFDTVIPHSDGAGIIESVGAGVETSRVGERVWLYNAQWGRAYGTAAERIVLPSDQAVLLPGTTSFVEGACLGVPACTAFQALAAADLLEGKQILIHGGAGSVGGYAIQMAKLQGAEVITTVSSADKEGAARAHGADVVINYREQDVVAALNDVTRGNGVAHIVDVDLGANIDVNAAILQSRGTIASYSSTALPEFNFDYYAFGYKGASVHFIQVYLLTPNERSQAIKSISQWLMDQAIHHRVAQEFPLDKIADAHQFQETGAALGNIVVSVF